MTYVAEKLTLEGDKARNNTVSMHVTAISVILGDILVYFDTVLNIYDNLSR